KECVSGRTPPLSGFAEGTPHRGVSGADTCIADQSRAGTLSRFRRTTRANATVNTANIRAAATTYHVRSLQARRRVRLTTLPGSGKTTSARSAERRVGTAGRTVGAATRATDTSAGT